MKILITGATGLIGKNLGLALTRQGHEITVVSRNKNSALEQCPFPCRVIEADLSKEKIKSEFLSGIDAVYNLMGEPIAQGRWSEDKKKRLIESRVQGTKNLRESFATAPKVFISSSAIGFYGDQGSTDLSETSSSGQDFLSDLCAKWENEALAFAGSETRVVVVRTGIVLSREGGALPEMLPAFRAGVGGKLGDGSQWMSWIHIDDLLQIYLEALDSKKISGVINGVSPHPVTNKEFTEKLSKVLSRPAVAPVPKIALKTLFGEKSVIMTSSQRVHPKKLLETGFQFKHSHLDTALRQELGHYEKDEEILISQQYVPQKPEEIFPFFSEAKNLEKITPALLNFKILSVKPAQLGEGALINYSLKVHGVPLTWKTRIESWNPPHQFVDNQLKGPYSLWHHTHSFEALGSGTLMTDRVRYRLPMGYLGWLGAGWLVAKDVKEIFQFRRKAIAKMFHKN